MRFVSVCARSVESERSIERKVESLLFDQLSPKHEGKIP